MLDGLGDDVSAVDVVAEKLVAPEMLVVMNVEILVDYFAVVMLAVVHGGLDVGDVVVAFVVAVVDVLVAALVGAPVGELNFWGSHRSRLSRRRWPSSSRRVVFIDQQPGLVCVRDSS